MDPSTEHDNADMATAAGVDHRPPCPCCGGLFGASDGRFGTRLETTIKFSRIADIDAAAQKAATLKVRLIKFIGGPIPP
jgi:hypothetical protein